MRIVALEEHVLFPDMVSLIPPELLNKNGMAESPGVRNVATALADIDQERLKSMDENDIALQVLSVVGPGADLFDPEKGAAFASKYNDVLAERIKPYPERFAAFAHLPMTSPEAAAQELERTVSRYGFKGALINGMTNEAFLDGEEYHPLLNRAEELGVPLYLHPGLPPLRVKEAYYSGLPKSSGDILSVAGWGWHSETAIHILRLIISGTFDKFPSLKIIIGHMGEMLPMMMARCDEIFKPGEQSVNKRTISETLRDQVYITTSGIFTQPPFVAALNTFGIDNILFSVDYPFAKNEMGKKFMKDMDLDKKDLAKLTHGNADKLLNLRRE